MSRLRLPYIASLFCFLLLLTSCKRAEPPFDELPLSPVIRHLSTEGSFQLADVENSQLDITVEFYDGNQGLNVAANSWTVEYISGSGDRVGPIEYIKSLSSGFGWNSNIRKELSVPFKLNRVLRTLGIEPSSLTGDDVFRFQSTLHMKDGSQYSGENIQTSILSKPAFDSLFELEVPVKCDLKDDMFVGSYTLMLDGRSGVWGGPFGETGTVIELEKTGDKERSFFNTLGLYYQCGNSPGGWTQIMFSCNQVIVGNIDTELDCDGEDLVIGQSEGQYGSFNIRDDKTFTIYITDDLFGACSDPVSGISYTFVKND